MNRDVVVKCGIIVEKFGNSDLQILGNSVVECRV